MLASQFLAKKLSTNVKWVPPKLPEALRDVRPNYQTNI